MKTGQGLRVTQNQNVLHGPLSVASYYCLVQGSQVDAQVVTLFREVCNWLQAALYLQPLCLQVFYSPGNSFTKNKIHHDYY